MSLHLLTNILAVESQHILLELGLDLTVLTSPPIIQIPIDLNPVMSCVLCSREIAICAFLAGAIGQACKTSTDFFLN